MPWVPSSHHLPAQASEQLPSSFFGGHLFPQQQYNQAAPFYRAAPHLQADQAAPIYHPGQRPRMGAALQQQSEQAAPGHQAAVRPQPDRAAPVHHPGQRPKIGAAHPGRPPEQQDLQLHQELKIQWELQNVRDIRGQHPNRKQARAHAGSQGQVHPQQAAQQAAQQRHQPVRNAVSEPPEYPNLPNSKLHNDLLDFATQATPTLVSTELPQVPAMNADTRFNRVQEMSKLRTCSEVRVGNRLAQVTALITTVQDAAMSVMQLHTFQDSVKTWRSFETPLSVEPNKATWSILTQLTRFELVATGGVAASGGGCA